MQGPASSISSLAITWPAEPGPPVRYARFHRLCGPPKTTPAPLWRAGEGKLSARERKPQLSEIVSRKKVRQSNEAFGRLAGHLEMYSGHFSSGQATKAI